MVVGYLSLKYFNALGFIKLFMNITKDPSSPVKILNRSIPLSIFANVKILKIKLYIIKVVVFLGLTVFPLFKLKL